MLQLISTRTHVSLPSGASSVAIPLGDERRALTEAFNNLCVQMQKDIQQLILDAGASITTLKRLGGYLEGIWRSVSRTSSSVASSHKDVVRQIKTGSSWVKMGLIAKLYSLINSGLF